jgi:tRNA G18 (ribose-2'-O)-methylase SpoU
MCSIFAAAVDRRQGDCQDARVARYTTIGEAGDPRLAPYTDLTDAAHRRRVEGRTGTFVVEGVTAIRRAATSPYPLRSVLVTPAKAQALAATLDPLDIDVFVADPDTMTAVAGFDIHRGAVAIAARLLMPALASLLGAVGTLAVLEGINDHENLGAVARSATALGADALVLDPTCADPLYRRCVRVSMGEVLHLPFTRAERWPAALADVSAAGFTLVALTPSSGAEPIDVVAARCGAQPIALLLGAEGPGLSAAAMAAADHRARIPLRAGADSLNVGHAAAIALYAFGYQTPSRTTAATTRSPSTDAPMSPA